MTDGFTLSLSKSRAGTRVVCVGDLDLIAAGRFKETVETLLRDENVGVLIDGTGITLMTAAGIEAMLRALEMCRAAGVRFQLEIGGHARRVLDLVGLWWLGVIDDGAEIDAVLDEARHRYAQLYDGFS